MNSTKQNQDKENIVYVLTNESMPDLVKIGTTSDLVGRMSSLYTTQVPVPFECFCAAEVENAEEVEGSIHRAFDDFRVNPKREFFKIGPEKVFEILKLVAIREVDLENYTEEKEDIEAIEKIKASRERFNFGMVGIQHGVTLTLKYGEEEGEEITCTVEGNNKVIYEGEEISLSGAALKALNSIGYNWKSAQGAACWKYEGETLLEMRERIEAE